VRVLEHRYIKDFGPISKLLPLKLNVEVLEV
jgi:hypothetical protein